MKCVNCGRWSKDPEVCEYCYPLGVNWSAEDLEVHPGGYILPDSIRECARIMVNAMVHKTHENGEEFVSVREEISENLKTVLQEIIRRAHGDMLPDNFKYKMIFEVSSNLRDLDMRDFEEFQPEELADVYTHQLTAWLASHTARTEYANESLDMAGPGAPMFDILLTAQGLEYREVFEKLVLGFEDWLEDIITEEEN